MGKKRNSNIVPNKNLQRLGWGTKDLLPSQLKGICPCKGMTTAGTAAVGRVSDELKSEVIKTAYLSDWLDLSGNAPESGRLFERDDRYDICAVDGYYLHYWKAFGNWMDSVSNSGGGLQGLILKQEQLDNCLRACGFYADEAEGVIIRLTLDKESLSDDEMEFGDDEFRILEESVINSLYGETGAIEIERGDDSITLCIDLPHLLNDFQVLTAYSASQVIFHRYLTDCIKELDKALGKALDSCDNASTAAEIEVSKVNSSLKSAEARIAQLESTLKSRPTKGDVSRLEKKIASLEADLAASQAEAASLREQSAQQREATLDTARTEVMAELGGRIDELVRLQSETEDRARAAEVRADEAGKLLDEALSEQEDSERRSRAEIAALKQSIADISSVSQPAPFTGGLAVADMPDLPSTALDVALLAADVFDGRIAFSEPAFESAEDYKGDTGEVWRVLRALATDGYDLFFGDESVEVRGEFQARTGFEMAMGESKILSKADAKVREVTFEGKVYNAGAHVKGSGRKTGSVLRVHFALDQERKLIVIGHCGEHLKTEGTKRRGR